ncbi:MAG: hypothetical protein ACRDE5_04000, partial [Ginsengibacter sp.]
RKRSVANQQKVHDQQVNANKEIRQATQNQQQHVHQMNAVNEKRQAKQNQQQQVQRMNAVNERTQAMQSRQRQTANNQHGEMAQHQQHAQQMNVSRRRQPQQRVVASRDEGKK